MQETTPTENRGSVLADEDRVDEEILSEVLSVFGDGVPDGLRQTCELLLTDVPGRLDDIDAALAASGLDAVARIEVARIAHGLTGSTGSFGARRLSALAARLDDLCRSADDGSAGALVAEMRAEFVLFRVILTDRLAELSA